MCHWPSCRRAAPRCIRSRAISPGKRGLPLLRAWTTAASSLGKRLFGERHIQIVRGLLSSELPQGQVYEQPAFDQFVSNRHEGVGRQRHLRLLVCTREKNASGWAGSGDTPGPPQWMRPPSGDRRSR